MDPDCPVPPPAPSSRGHRILLAEDSPSVRQLALAILTQSGYEVDTVATGQAAVAALQSTRYDLVLMDIEMPVMSGLVAAAAIRRLPGPAASTPILALTANTEPDDRCACRKAGMDDFLPKPIERGALLHRVGCWLGRGDGDTPGFGSESGAKSP